MSADAVGADQHQRADRIPRRLLHVGRRDFSALGLGLAPDLVAKRPLDFAPVASQRGQEFAVGADQPRRLPGRPVGVPGDIGPVVFEALEERLPFGIDRLRVELIAGLELLDIGGVAALKERSAGKSRVRVLS
jgi:hypothetical protein